MFRKFEDIFFRLIIYLFSYSFCFLGLDIKSIVAAQPSLKETGKIPKFACAFPHTLNLRFLTIFYIPLDM